MQRPGNKFFSATAFALDQHVRGRVRDLGDEIEELRPGTVSIMRSSPLERRERDARAAAKHIAMTPDEYIRGGKLRLGCDLSNVSF